VEELGDAFTFVTHEDMGLVRDIEKVLGKPIERRTLAGFDYKTESADKEERRTPRTPNRAPFRRPGTGSGRKPQFAGSRSR
jgi:ATP-dependent RNA helicase RhlE